MYQLFPRLMKSRVSIVTMIVVTVKHNSATSLRTNELMFSSLQGETVRGTQPENQRILYADFLVSLSTQRTEFQSLDEP